MKIRYMQTKKEDPVYGSTVVDFYHVWDSKETIMKDNQKITVIVNQDYSDLERLIYDERAIRTTEKEFNLDDKMATDFIKDIKKREELTIEINSTMQTIELIRG